MSDDTHTVEGPTSPMRPSLGQPGDLVAGRYKLGALLGAGGMGRVFQAEHTTTGGMLAVKLARGGEDAYARFASEARTTASLLHPNIVRLFDFGRGGELLYLAMEYVPGNTLRALLQDAGALPWRRAAALVEQILMALGYAHEQGVVHRDIKPANVLVTHFLGRDDFVRVVDFGIAHALRDTTATLGPTGTPAYMAPEQWLGAATPASDLYALGCVTYALLTGAPPFQGSIEALRHHHAHTLPAPLPGPLAGWVARLLSKDPERRPTALEALEALRALMSPDRAPPGTTHRALPVYRGAFVGRQRALEALDRMEAAGATCVTLVGPAGVGKSRLAVEWAVRRAADHDAVAFCGLADAGTRDAAFAALAQTLGVQLGASDPVEALGQALARRGRALLVLDNLEGLTELLRPALEAWRDAAPEALLLITSRQAVAMAGESLLRLEPLTPPPEEARDPEALRSNDAVELFVRRAQDAHPGWRWEADGAGEVAALVRELDGLPLALELAAARLRVLSVAQLRARLDARLALLKKRGDARHGTLTLALDVSWALLEPDERDAFTRCAVFQGAFSLEDAEAVLRDVGAVDLLEALVDRSLLRVQDTARGPRFSMYAFVQAYARHRLTQTPALATDAAARHLTRVAALGTREALAGLERDRETLARLGEALENLEAGRRWGLEHGHHEEAARCVAALGEYLYRQGPVGRGRAVVGEALAALASDAPARPRLLFLAGKLAWSAGAGEEAAALYQEGLQACAEVTDRVSEASLHYGVGVLHRLAGRMDEAVVSYEASLRCAREAGSEARQGWALMGLSVVRRITGDATGSIALLEQALAHSRSARDARLEGSALHVLGTSLESQGRSGPSAGCFERAVECARQTGDRRLESAALVGLGRACELQGRFTDATRSHRACLALAREAGDRWLEGAALAGLGRTQVALGRTAEADRSLRDAATLALQTGDVNLVGWIRCAQADLALLTDHPEAAALRAQAALDAAAETEDLSLRGLALCVLGHAAALLDQDTGDAHLRDAAALADDLDEPPLALQAALRRATVALQRDDPGEALEVLQGAVRADACPPTLALERDLLLALCDPAAATPSELERRALAMGLAPEARCMQLLRRLKRSIKTARSHT